MSSDTRTHNSIVNVSFGFIVTAISAVLSFITRTVLVRTLGKDALGINGLFTEVISVLSLAELGVGSAIVYNLYKPLKENDEERIDQLMYLYKRAYNIIAFITLFIGLIVTPFIQYLIKDISYPLSYIRVVFLLFIVQTSSSYLFSYKTSLLNADQKQYIVSLYTLVLKIVFTGINVFLLAVYKNYIVYLTVMIIQALLTNIAVGFYVDKRYPYLTYRKKIDDKSKKEVLVNIKDIFIKRVSGVITNSTDNILISTLVSTVKVGLYSNYTIIFNLFRVLKDQLANGITASIGNLMASETSEKCAEILYKLTFLFYVIAIFCCTELMSVSKLFIAIWLGKSFVLQNEVVILAIFSLFLELTLSPLWQYLEVSGLFGKDKYISILGSSINLIVSIVLGLRIGMAGIFLGTVISRITQGVLKTQLLFNERLSLRSSIYYRAWIKYAVCYGISVLASFLVQRIYLINNAVSLLAQIAVSGLFSITLLFLFYRGTNEMQYFWKLTRSILHKNKIKLTD